MNEDISVKVTADTSPAEKKIDKLSGKKVDVQISADDAKIKALQLEIDKLGKRASDIRLKPNAFKSEDVKYLKNDIEVAAAKAQAIYFADGNASAAELNDRLKDMHQSLATSNKEAQATGAIFQSLAVTVGMLGTQILSEIVRGLSQAVKEGARLSKQLDYARAKIQTISGDDTGVIRDTLSSMAKASGTSQAELSEGLYQVVSAIGDVSKKYDLLDVANKLAITGFSDVASTVDGLTTVLNAYGLSVDDAAHVAEVFVKTQKVGKLTVQEFQAQLYKTVPIAKELNIGIEEIGASMALLTSKGTKAEVGQTQMAAFLYELQDADSEISKLFQKISGMSVGTYFTQEGASLRDLLKQLKEYQNATNVDITGMLGRKEAKSFYMNTAGDLDGLIAKFNEINTDTGELEKNMNLMGDTIELRMKRASEYTNDFKAAMGEAYNSLVAKIGDAVTGYDHESAARAQLNGEMEKNLNTLRDLGGQTDLTKEEQERLNSALTTLKLMEPQIAAVYANFTNGAASFADVLALVSKRQLEVIQNNANLRYSENLKKKQELEGQISEKRIQTAQDLGIASTYTLKDGALFDPTAAPLSAAGAPVIEPEKLQASIDDKIAKGAFDKISNANEQAAAKSNYLAMKAQEEELKKINAELAASDDYLKKMQDTEKQKNAAAIAKTEAKSAPTPAATADKAEPQKAAAEVVQSARDVQAAAVDKMNNLTEEFNNAAEKLKGKDGKITDKAAFAALQANYNKSKASLQSDTSIGVLQAQRAELVAGARNETDTSKKDKTERDIKELDAKIKALQLDQQKTEIEGLAGGGSGGGGGRASGSGTDRRAREQADKAYRERDLQIQNEYAEKELQLKLQYYADLNNAVLEGNQQLIDQITEQYQTDTRKLQSSKKLDTLSNQATKPGISALDKRNIELQQENLQANNKLTEFEDNKAKRDKEANELLASINSGMANLAEIVSSVGSGLSTNTGSSTLNAINGVLGVGSQIISGLSGISNLSSMIGGGAAGIVSSIASGLGSVAKGSKVGNIVTGLMGGGTTGTIGGTLGSVAGTVIGGPVGSIIGGALGSLAGSLFGGGNSKEKEEKKYKKAADKMKKGQEAAAKEWEDYMKDYTEALEKSGAQKYITTADKLDGKTNGDTIYEAINNKQNVKKDSSSGGAYKVNMEALREWLPQFDDDEIKKWFAAQVGGSKVSTYADGSEWLSAGQGSYGIFDLQNLADAMASVNSDFADSLKDKIKEIINFTADSIASTVQNGFGEGLEDLGDNLEKMVASSLKTAFMNTDIAKGLFNGLSDNVSDMIKQMFKDDANLGVSMDTSTYTTPQDYIAAIKQYMELSNGKLEEIFASLGMSLDNLDESVDTLNANLSKNTVQGMATNLWKYNAGQSLGGEFNDTTIEVPIYIGTDQIEKKIIKIANDSLSKARRNRFS